MPSVVPARGTFPNPGNPWASFPVEHRLDAARRWRRPPERSFISPHEVLSRARDFQRTTIESLTGLLPIRKTGSGAKRDIAGPQGCEKLPSCRQIAGPVKEGVFLGSEGDAAAQLDFRAGSGGVGKSSERRRVDEAIRRIQTGLIQGIEDLAADLEAPLPGNGELSTRPTSIVCMAGPYRVTVRGCRTCRPAVRETHSY